MKVSFGGVFRLGGSLPFRSGVVVSLRPLSVCHGSMWLVPAFFPSLSLSFPVCAHFQLGWNFLLLPDCPSPYFGLLVCWFLWLLFSARVTYLRDRVTPAGSWTACPRSERRFSISIWVRYAGQFLAGHPASVCGYLRAMSLRVCCLVVLNVSRNRLCPLSVDCLLGLELSPSGVASASDGRFSWHPGAAGALAVPSLRLRVSESSSLSAWSFPFRGLYLFLAFVPLLEAMSESLTHSFPRSFLVVALYASAVGFADALWLCPERALRRFSRIRRNLFIHIARFSAKRISSSIYQHFKNPPSIR